MTRPAPDPVVGFHEAQDEGARLTRREGRVELLRTQELRREVLPPPPARVLDVGFAEVRVHGVEGPGWHAVAPSAGADDPLVEQVLEIARLADADHASAGASAHLLATATR